MAKAKWQTGWPRGGDIRQWMRCLIAKASLIADLPQRVKYTSSAVEELAARGFLAEATKELERMIRALPAKEGFHRVGLLELGAKMHVADGDLAKKEKYLQRILATKPLHTRPSAKDWEVQVVREFKVFHGLLDPSDA